MSGLRAQGRNSVVLVCLALVGSLALSGATSADPTCTVNWTGGAHDSLWTSAGNWSSGSVPSSSDRACVTTAVTVKVTSGVSQVGSLSSAGTLTIAGGSLELTSASTGSSVASLTVQSGTLLGAGALTVSSVLSWTGGTLSGAGSTVLASGATGTVNPGNLNQVTLDQRTLVNQGTLTWSSGSIVVYDSAEIDNSGTLIANAQYPTSPYWTNAGIINEDASASWVHNTGTFKKTSGSGATTVQVGYDNAGTTLSSSGQLGFYGGSHGAQAATGSWSASASASLAFSGGSFLLGAAAALSGTIDFTGASVQAGDVQGAGATLVISAGSLELTSAGSASSVAGLTLQSGGTLTGAGTLNVSGTFSWTGGTMAGTGSTALGSSATATVNPGNSNQVTLDRRTLANHGTLSWSSGSLALSSSAEIDNSGTFNANAQYPTSPYWTYSGILNSDASSPWVHNTGTFKKASGTGTTAVQVAYDNEGTTSASAGQLGFYAGGEPGQAAAGAWASTGTASLALNGGSFALGAAVALSGTINLAGASVQAGDVQGASAATLALSGGSLELTSTSTTSNVYVLTLSGGTLQGAGTLSAAHTLTWTGGTMSGAGVTTLASGATGTVNPGSYNAVTLDQRTLRNQGTLTWSSGSMALYDGAEIDNGGTFNANAQYPTSPYWTNSGIFDEDGSGAWVHDTGTFKKASGSGTTAILAAFDNQGSVLASSGQLAFYGGGYPGRAASGPWTASSGASIAFTQGTYVFSSSSTRQGTIYYNGGTIMQASAPSGSLNPMQYAFGTSTISGLAASTGSGFQSATVQITLAGQSSWQTLCGPLTPDLMGAFSCLWSTASGSYPDGSYQLRAQLSDASMPPATAPTAAVSVVVDNTSPSGSITPVPYLHATAAIAGVADDAGAGVASWQPQITAAGQTSWQNACPVQSTPSNGDHYGCSIDTGAYQDGAYELRAVITDGVGNTSMSSAITTSVDNTPPSGTLDAPSPDSSGMVALSGDAADQSGVASWIPQITADGDSDDWGDACDPAGISLVAGRYSCALDTAQLGDGPYDVRALVTDNAGNTYTTASADATFDNTPPVGVLSQLGVYSTGLISVQGVATDDTSDVAGWQLQISPGGQGSWTNACPMQLSPSVGLMFGCSINTAGLADGSYDFQAVLTDSVGNSYTTPVASTHVENSALTGLLQVPSPAHGLIEVDGPTADSLADITGWTLQGRAAGQSWQNLCPTQTTALTGTTYGCAFDSGAFVDGTYELQAVITDSLGRTFTTPSVSVVIDNTPPDVVLSGDVSDSAGALTGGSHSLTVSASSHGVSLKQVELAIDGQDPAAYTGTLQCSGVPCSATTDLGVDMGELTPGPHSLDVTVTDVAGNMTHQTLGISRVSLNTAFSDYVAGSATPAETSTVQGVMNFYRHTAGLAGQPADGAADSQTALLDRNFENVEEAVPTDSTGLVDPEAPPSEGRLDWNFAKSLLEDGVVEPEIDIFPAAAAVAGTIAVAVAIGTETRRLLGLEVNTDTSEQWQTGQWRLTYQPAGTATGLAGSNASWPEGPVPGTGPGSVGPFSHGFWVWWYYDTNSWYSPEPTDWSQCTPLRPEGPPPGATPYFSNLAPAACGSYQPATAYYYTNSELFKGGAIRPLQPGEDVPQGTTNDFPDDTLAQKLLGILGDPTYSPLEHWIQSSLDDGAEPEAVGYLTNALQQNNSGLTEQQADVAARTCLAYEQAAGQDGLDKCQSLPIFLSGTDVSTATSHDIDAIGQYPPWVNLNYQLGSTKTSPRGWASRHCNRTDGEDCHEYPFYATEQGGRDAEPTPKVSAVASADNRTQGTIWYNNFIRPCRVSSVTDSAAQSEFLSIPQKDVPTFAVCNRGTSTG
ncbi:MAG TPA: Ig-like domain repeat protein [Solirubrobacteraceae bacterium]|nr:Ig-like domain repeat protein [Solirubrobacteraceae bacterium]